MMTCGYIAGKAMGFSSISSLFLGAMLSMSSTTIILKALNDLNMSHRRFAPQVLAVLIVEDVFAVIMMVVLSSIAVNNTVSGEELLKSVGKLAFFLVMWFLVGIYVIPSFLSKQRKYLTDELMLVLSVGLCFMMVIFSSYSGFSSALGAFVMGSILAGTSASERIEKLITPVKDLFGAIFFVSVGMMVDPHILTTYAIPILLLSGVVIVGMILFGTAGMLLSGQPLRIAIESGFSLTQIGEFSFIIATLGMSLGVIDSNLYPIIVSVSVITTFFTPYFIKLSDPVDRWLEKHLPRGLMRLLSNYSESTTKNESEFTALWKKILKRSLTRILIYSVVLVAVLVLSKYAIFPLAEDLGGEVWGELIAVGITLLLMAPFLLALCYPSAKKWEKEKLQTTVKSNVPFFAIRFVRVIIAFGFLVFFLLSVYSHAIVVTLLIAIATLAAILVSKSVRRHINKIENKFIDNLNERELRRSGRNNNLVSDMHLAYIDVTQSSPIAGQRLADSAIGKRFGVNVVDIQRGDLQIPIPTGDTRIFPGDTLGVVGTDEQIQRMLQYVEKQSSDITTSDDVEIDFTSIELSPTSAVAFKKVGEVDFRGKYSVMVVSVQHPDGTFEKPRADTLLQPGDNVWVVGDKKKIKQLI